MGCMCEDRWKVGQSVHSCPSLAMIKDATHSEILEESRLLAATLEEIDNRDERARNTPQKKLRNINLAYRQLYLRHCNEYISSPPLSALSKASELKTLTDGIETEILLELRQIQDQINVIDLTQEIDDMLLRLDNVEKRDEFTDWLGHRKLIEDYTE